MLPTTHRPVLMPTPMLIGMNSVPLALAAASRSRLSRVDAFEHVERGFAGVELVGRVVERRVPERHDGVAHVFVDRALAVDDGVGQRREEAVHQRGQTLRIVLVDLRDRGEAADVAEHDRHVARFAAEHELLRRLRELLDQRRARDIGRTPSGSGGAAPAP